MNNVQSQIDNENVFIQSSRNFLGIEIQLIENHPGENHWIYDKTNNTLDTVALVIDVYELLEKKLNKRLKNSHWLQN